MITRKRQMNNLVPPPKLCKLIPAGEFKKSVLVWELNVWEKVDDAGNVIERNKMLALTTRDALGKKHKIPKTAKQRLKQLKEFCPERKMIYYREAIYPAPTLQEVFSELITEYFSMKHNKDTLLWESCFTNSVYVSLDKNPIVCLMKLWLKQKGVEV